MKEFRRKQLLERIRRDGATIGEQIPTRIKLNGESVALREFVFEIRRRETYPQSERDRVETALLTLRRGRRRRQQQIKNNQVSYDDGQILAKEIIGIDRALNALESLEPVDIEAESQQHDVADQQRWLSFLRRALGQDKQNYARRFDS